MNTSLRLVGIVQVDVDEVSSSLAEGGCAVVAVLGELDGRVLGIGRK